MKLTGPACTEAMNETAADPSVCLGVAAAGLAFGVRLFHFLPLCRFIPAH
jgi:hypothetical protein